MEKKKLTILILIILLLGGGAYFLLNSEKKNKSLPPELEDLTMQITSLAFSHNGEIPSKYTCDGENISPTLEISFVPEQTKSLVLLVDDPDAPAGIWTHWTVWNIKPETREISENSLPEGAVEGITSFGRRGYGGPCPPSGIHRYFFKLFALDNKLNLDPSSEVEQLVRAMEGHILAKAELVGKYKRL